MRQRAMTVAAVLVILASAAQAQVSCSDPDNLCTGDPCVIDGTFTVVSPCDVDFGSRTLTVRGRMRVPNAGELSFSAGAITVEAQGGIDGSNVVALGGVGTGADITLTASGAIAIDGDRRW